MSAFTCKIQWLIWCAEASAQITLRVKLKREFHLMPMADSHFDWYFIDFYYPIDRR